MAGSKTRYIPALDGLRAFAVLSVIVYHMGYSWAQGGLLGVTVFFVLSGYLITGLLITEWTNTKTIDLKNFWLRRVRRLVPAIVFVIITVAALCAIFNHELLTKMRPDIPSALLFFSNWWYIFHDVSYFEALGAPSPINHFWSLAIEEQFYLVWPVLLLGAFKLGAKKPLLRRITLVLAVVSAVAMATLYDPAVDPSRIYYGTDTRAFSLLIGAWLAFLWPASRFDERSGSTMTVSERRLFDGLGVAAFVGLAIMVALVDGFSPFLYRGGLVLASILTAIVIAVISHPKSRFGSVFSARPLVWIGKRSYGMYLWHFPILLLMNPVNSTGETSVWYHALQLLVIFVISEFSFRFVEDPVRKGIIGQTIGGLRDGSIDPHLFFRQSVFPWVASGAIVVVALGGIIFVPPTNAVGDIDAIKHRTVDITRFLDTSLLPLVGTRSIGEDNPLPEPPPKRYDVLMIGDSVSVRIEPEFYATFPEGMLDAAISRQFSTGQSLYETYRDEEVVGKYVVIALGTNGLATDEQVDDLLSDIGPKKDVYLINTRSPRDWVDPMNALLAQAADARNNVHLIDWYGASADHDEYFDGDGTHLTEEGAKVYVGLIKQAMGR